MQDERCCKDAALSVLNMFSKRSLEPSLVVIEEKPGSYRISINVPDLEPSYAAIIAEKARAHEMTTEMRHLR